MSRDLVFGRVHVCLDTVFTNKIIYSKNGAPWGLCYYINRSRKTKWNDSLICTNIFQSLLTLKLGKGQVVAAEGDVL